MKVLNSTRIHSPDQSSFLPPPPPPLLPHFWKKIMENWVQEICLALSCIHKALASFPSTISKIRTRVTTNSRNNADLNRRRSINTEVWSMISYLTFLVIWQQVWRGIMKDLFYVSGRTDDIGEYLAVCKQYIELCISESSCMSYLSISVFSCVEYWERNAPSVSGQFHLDCINMADIFLVYLFTFWATSCDFSIPLLDSIVFKQVLIILLKQRERAWDYVVFFNIMNIWGRYHYSSHF